MLLYSISRTRKAGVHVTVSLRLLDKFDVLLVGILLVGILLVGEMLVGELLGGGLSVGELLGGGLSVGELWVVGCWSILSATSSRDQFPRSVGDFKSLINASIFISILIHLAHIRQRFCSESFDFTNITYK